MGNHKRPDLYCAVETFCGLTVLLILVSVSCARRNAETQNRSSENKRSLSCAPRTAAATNLSLAIVSIEPLENKTRIRLVAYAKNEPINFYLPVYLMSRGRWLINDRARAYLLDEKCREYRLNDRKSTEEMPAPIDGQIELQARTAFETILEFPPLARDINAGLLVYDSYVVPFTLLQSLAN